jgi:hypothetical protein
MSDSKNQLPEGEFRKNADRDDIDPEAPAPAPKGPKVPSGAENADWEDMDRRKQEKIQRG